MTETVNYRHRSYRHRGHGLYFRYAPRHYGGYSYYRPRQYGYRTYNYAPYYRGYAHSPRYNRW